MANKKNISYTNRDFDTIKSGLIEHAKRYYPERYKDFSEASFGSMVFDAVSYVGDVLSFYLDYQINESFLTTANDYANVRELAESLGYKERANASAFGIASFYIIAPKNTIGLGPNVDYMPILKKNSTFSSPSGGFILLDDVDFSGYDTETVAARFDPASGIPTHYAIKSYGRVMSGIFKRIDIPVGNYERYKKLTMVDTKVTKIISVVDSEGHIYYEVDNLAQSVIYKETTNPTYKSDGVTSILKPVVAPRRFTASIKGSNTILQFGHGSDSEASSEDILDPTSVLVKRHGFSFNTNKNFDPYKLISNDSLGISPANTVLTIRYIENQSENMNLAPNQLNTIANADLFFEDESILDPAELSLTIGSLEITNEKQILGSTFQSDSSEELRI